MNLKRISDPSMLHAAFTKLLLKANPSLANDAATIDGLADKMIELTDLWAATHPRDSEYIQKLEAESVDWIRDYFDKSNTVSAVAALAKTR